MNFLSDKEKRISKNFLAKGYSVFKIKEIKSLNFIHSLVLKNVRDLIGKKKFFNLNFIHKEISISDLNDFRVSLINKINKNRLFKFHYFNVAKEKIYLLAGNELMMQKNINLSIQFPNDSSSLLPIHSDVWSGDSEFEINLWLPLVDCYRTKSMYILDQKYNDFFLDKMNRLKLKSSDDIYNFLKPKLKWLNIKYGDFLLFNQGLPHGNVVNKEGETRWSMNCRFKTFFSPYGDKKIGEFFIPITTRAMTEIGMNFKYPFKK